MPFYNEGIRCRKHDDLPSNLSGAEEVITFYKEISVWKRKSSTCLIQYRCFELLEERKFCVQSVDFFQAPFKNARRASHEEHFLELLAEDNPANRSGLHDTLEEALQAYDKEMETSHI